MSASGIREGWPALWFQGVGGADTTYMVTIDAAGDGYESKVRAIVGAFIAAGAAGGFARQDVKPAESSLILGSMEVIAPGAVRCNVRAKRMDIRAFQVMRSMAGRLIQDGVRVRTIRIVENGQPYTTAREVAEPEDGREDEAYPNMSEVIEFEIKSEKTDVGKVRRCLVEYREPLTAGRIRSLAAWIRPWYVLLEGGGFTMPIDYPYEAESYRGTVAVFDEITAEISIDRFQADEMAWDVLCNMLDAFDEESKAISKVIID